jgi:hypothetical protein
VADGSLIYARDTTRECVACGGTPAWVKVDVNHWRKECERCGSTGAFRPLTKNFVTRAHGNASSQGAL